MSKMRPLAAALGAAVGLALVAPAAFAAGPYAGQACVSAKLKSAATQCQADLKAWSKWETTQDAIARDAALGANAAKLATAWTKAEGKATAKGADCVETTLTAAETSTALDAAISDIVTSINTGLTLPADGKCGAALLKAASKKCGAFLKAESTYLKKLAKDPAGTGRDAAQTKASTKFTTAFTAAATGCSTTATVTDIEDKIDQLTEDTVTDATTSPHTASTWTEVDPPTTVTYQGRPFSPICSRGTPYAYWVKRGSEDGLHKLLVYYQGGGACWDAATCAAATGAFDDDVTPGDNPANTTTGLGDLTNPNNPFANWNAVFISYCTGDIHWGDNKALYKSGPPFGNVSIQHKGFENAKVVEKWAREHFVNPDEVFVTGSSAGAYGAILHGIYLHDVFPASKFNVVGDAGNGVITQHFLTVDIANWNIQPNIPSFIPGLNASVQTLTIADLYGKAAAFYLPRGSHFAQYTTAYDGGSGSQTFFYNVMVNGILDNANWWHSSCAWNTQMKANDLAAAAEAPSNYRYYIGPGSRHTIYGSNRVYTETHGGVPTFVDWLNDMRAGAVGWTNVECTDCSLLGSCAGGANAGASCQHDSECPASTCTPIDARPSPLQHPFELGDGLVNCP